MDLLLGSWSTTGFMRYECERAGRENQGAARAFTLIELLVVIAVIAILASLLLPGLSQAKATALSAKCKSNLRQNNIGLQMYVGDYEGYPGGHVGASFDGTIAMYTNLWSYLLEPYTGQRWTGPLYECPTFKFPIYAQGKEIHKRGGYGYNAHGIGGDLDRLGLSLARESRVIAPSDMIAVLDDFTLVGGKRIFPNFIMDGIIKLRQHSGILQLVEAGPNYAQMRHRGRINVTFCDGHLESPRYGILFIDPTDNVRKRWQLDNQPHHSRWLTE